jgi:tyrosyl-tRNA synthetase
VWLDPQKTTPFQFYQFWLNASDEGVGKYLRLFTLLPLDEIEKIETEQAQNPGKRVAQGALAYTVTEMIHGRMNANAAQRVSEILFGGLSLADVTPIERDMLSATAPKHHTSQGAACIDELVASGLAQSKREAREFIEGGAVTINGVKVSDVALVLGAEHFVGGLALVKRGKKNVSLFAL